MKNLNKFIRKNMIHYMVSKDNLNGGGAGG